jgi:hypothetical protein
VAHPRQPPCHRRICRCGIPSRPKSPSTRKKSPTSAWGRSTSSIRRLPEHPGSANKLPGRAVGAAEAAGAAEAVAEAAEAAEAAAAAGAAGAAAAAVRRGEFAASARFEHFLRTVGWAKTPTLVFVMRSVGAPSPLGVGDRFCSRVGEVHFRYRVGTAHAVKLAQIAKLVCVRLCPSYTR